MSAVAHRTSKTKSRHGNRPVPPDLVLQETTPQQSQTLSSNSSSSINSQPSSVQQQQKLGQPQHPSYYKSTLSPNIDPYGSVGITTGGATQFQTYTAQYPSYRPYTPTTPTTPTGLQPIAIPMTPTAGLGLAISPRSEHSASFPSLPKPASTAGGLFPYGKSHRASITRRMPSNEFSLYDPYRSRQPGMSANRVKNEYQAQSPKRDSPAVFPQQSQSYYSRHGSNEELHNLHVQILDGGLTEEQAFAMMHPPPPIDQRKDQYRHSPTLIASQALAATYNGRPESPFQSYLPYQPYTNQQQLPSPTLVDVYRSSGSLSSPGLGPYLSHYGVYEERSEYKADPYRSAYSQSANNNNNSAAVATAAANQHSPYLGSGSGSPNPQEDFSSSFDSRLSGHSSQPNSSNSLRYPMRDLAGQDSNQALSASYYEHGRKYQQQTKKAATTNTSSSENDGAQSNPDAPTAVSSSSGHQTRQSTQQQPSQTSKTDSSGTKKAKSVEEDDDDEILRKLGVLSAGSGGTRSGLSSQSHRKGQWTSDSEEEGRAKAGAGRVMLFFVIPRTPMFTYESVISGGPAQISSDGIEEPFHIQLSVDSMANYLPIRVNRLNLKIWLQSEDAKIADNADLSSEFVIQPRAIETISIPMRLQYRSTKKGGVSERILNSLIEACTPISQSATSSFPSLPGSPQLRPRGFDIIVSGKLDVWGLSLVWKPEFTISVEDVPCPVNAANPSTSNAPTVPSGVITLPPATAIAAGATSIAPSPTLDPARQPTITHALVIAKRTASAASLSTSTPAI
ncbi:hypothetical protein FBU30_010990 [Linnemannia zychae]|nr:hypothetical protein FBU30_010990 [Linnemannia zychae]